MNPEIANQIKRNLQKELMRRSLNQFFMEHGYENFDLPLYPPICSTIGQKIPHLGGRIEIVPFSEEVDVQTGVHTIGWNLFILGTNRLYLGNTCHTNVSDIERSIRGEVDAEKLPMSTMKSTPNKLINFILKVLDNCKTGYVNLPAGFIPTTGLDTGPLGGSIQQTPRVGPTGSGNFYSK